MLARTPPLGLAPAATAYSHEKFTTPTHNEAAHIKTNFAGKLPTETSAPIKATLDRPRHTQSHDAYLPVVRHALRRGPFRLLLVLHFNVRVRRFRLGLRLPLRFLRGRAASTSPSPSPASSLRAVCVPRPSFPLPPRSLPASPVEAARLSLALTVAAALCLVVCCWTPFRGGRGGGMNGAILAWCLRNSRHAVRKYTAAAVCHASEFFIHPGASNASIHAPRRIIKYREVQHGSCCSVSNAGIPELCEFLGARVAVK